MGGKERGHLTEQKEKDFTYRNMKTKIEITMLTEMLMMRQTKGRKRRPNAQNKEQIN